VTVTAVGAAGWAGPVAVGLLLAAGLPRLVRGSPAQRALATALCSSAVVLALEPDVVQRSLGGPGAAPFAALAQCLGITVASAAAYAMARQVAPGAPRPALSPAAAGLPVGLAQCLLFAASGTADRPLAGPLFHAGADRPAVVALWLLTAAAAGAAGAVLVPLLLRHGPGLPLLRSRFAAACTVAGAVVVGFAGVAAGAQLVLRATGRPGAAEALTGAAPLAPLGLAVVAVGVLTARTVTALDPVRRWWRAHRALHRLAGLAAELATAVPEWAATSVEDRWTLRDPAGRLYRRVIAIRDASWTLLGALDDDPARQRAAEFARTRLGAGPAAAALAEACWLHAALRARVAEPRRREPRPVQFPGRHPEPPGSVDDEAAALVAVARAWSSPLVAEFLDRADHHAAWRAGRPAASAAGGRRAPVEAGANGGPMGAIA
jgi:hypothetical protein